MFRCSYLESETEKATGLMGQGHRTEQTYTGRRGHRTYFLDKGNNTIRVENKHILGGGTPHTHILS